MATPVSRPAPHGGRTVLLLVLCTFLPLAALAVFRGRPRAGVLGNFLEFHLGRPPTSRGLDIESALAGFGPPVRADGSTDALHLLFAGFLAYQAGGLNWEEFNRNVRDPIIEAQRKDMPGMGSWDPAGEWAGAGRVAATALHAGILELYYAYPPMYGPR